MKNKRIIASCILVVMEDLKPHPPKYWNSSSLLLATWAFQDIINMLFWVFLAIRFLIFQSTVGTVQLFTPLSSFAWSLILIVLFRWFWCSYSFVLFLSPIQPVILVIIFLWGFRLVCCALTSSWTIEVDSLVSVFLDRVRWWWCTGVFIWCLSRIHTVRWVVEPLFSTVRILFTNTFPTTKIYINVDMLLFRPIG